MSSVDPGAAIITSNTSSSVIIHVCDEAKKLKKDFVCQRDVLLHEMRYFADYLSDKNNWEDIDISVHCDIQIFDWLMRYIHCKDREKRPRLETHMVISILISSDFLCMDELVEHCLSFCCSHINNILCLPIDLSCIQGSLLNRLAMIFTHEQLDSIVDTKDALVSRLFTTKVEQLLVNGTSLFMCLHCNRILADEFQLYIPCSRNRVGIDYHGNVVHHHQYDRSWDVNTYILFLRKSGKSWTEVYWKIWSITNSFLCQQCGEHFCRGDFGHCLYHPQMPQFGHGDAIATGIGIFPCCSQPTLRFDPVGVQNGCAVRNHVPVIRSAADKAVLDVIEKHTDVIMNSYQPIKENHQLNLFAADELMSGVSDAGGGAAAAAAGRREAVVAAAAAAAASAAALAVTTTSTTLNRSRRKLVHTLSVNTDYVDEDEDDDDDMMTNINSGPSAIAATTSALSRQENARVMFSTMSMGSLSRVLAGTLPTAAIGSGAASASAASALIGDEVVSFLPSTASPKQWSLNTQRDDDIARINDMTFHLSSMRKQNSWINRLR